MSVSTKSTGDYFTDRTIPHTVYGLRSAKKFIDNYKINIYMTHGTLNIYIYDTQHL